MNIQTFEFNPVRENTYILYDETKECVIVDPGCFYEEEQEMLIQFIESNQLIVKQILNTHLHFDHVFGSAFVQEKFGLETQANKADEFLVDNLSAQLQLFGFSGTIGKPIIGKYLKEGDVVTFGNQKLSVFEVPGHSPGSVVFYNKEAGCVVSGDALFRSSIGRTDLPQGSQSTLVKAIKEKLFTLPANTVVYPGHGPQTTIGYEMQHNPFLQ